MLSMQEYNENVRSMNIMRWTAVIVYMLAVFAVSFFPLFFQEIGESRSYLVVVLSVTFGGMILMFGALLYPYFKKTEMPEVADGTLVEGIIDPKDLPEVHNEKIRTFLVYELMIPFTVLMAGYTVFYLFIFEWYWTLFNIVFTMGFVVILIMFGHLEVTATKDHLHFHYGPAGKKIPMSEIKSIRSVPVHAMRDFMGWGIRGSPDGTVGYIARGNVGIRVILKSGKRYVITVRDPEALVAYVRAARKKK
jgi:hypothetical protein